MAVGFEVNCPFCLDEDSTILVDLRDLRECQCSSCNETFTPQAAYEKARELAKAWRKIVEWIESAPIGGD
jgi:hypothetical protein